MKKINKAIRGRRNRCHAFPPVILMGDSLKYDMAAQAEFRKLVEKLSGSPNAFKWILASKYDVEVIQPNQGKRPRFLN